MYFNLSNIVVYGSRTAIQFISTHIIPALRAAYPYLFFPTWKPRPSKSIAQKFADKSVQLQQQPHYVIYAHCKTPQVRAYIRRPERARAIPT